MSKRFEAAIGQRRYREKYMDDLAFANFQSINATIKNRPVALFGAGNICSKTLRCLAAPPVLIVDNSANLWGMEQESIQIASPDALSARDDRPFIVICTTSFPEVASQLKDMEYRAGHDFCVSPVLNDWRAIVDVEQASATLLLTSGLSSSGTTKGTGGLYRLRFDEGTIGLQHLLRGSAHGIIRQGGMIYVIEDTLGIAELGSDLAVKRNMPLPPGSRGHGLSWSPDTECFYVACSYLDQILELAPDFTIRRRLSVSSKTGSRNGPHHHVNDCLVWGDSLFVSMFSLTGNWKKGVFDGGILEIDVPSGERVGNFAEGLWMPHNVANVNGTMAVLDSLPGSLLMGNLREVGNFAGFTRGLAWDDRFMYIGQSRNRNFSSQIGISNNISLDSGVVVFDVTTKLSKFVQIPRHITEIHGLCVLD